MSQYISFSEPIPPIPTEDEGDFCVRFDAKFIPYIVGALQALLDNSTYESDIESSVAQAHDLIATIQTGVCDVSMPVGAIIQYATSSVPSNCLPCDGSSHLRVDYPDLYAALDSQFKTDADHFVTPDFRGRVPVGTGTGSGLTARTMNDSFGAETHQLTTAQLPVHNHAVNVGTTAATGNTAFTMGANGAATGSSANGTQSAGTGAVHNNVQPSRAIGFCIVAAAS